MINGVLADEDWEPDIGDIVTTTKGFSYRLLENGVETIPFPDFEGWFGAPYEG